ncbi:glycine--tRNA ligase subunit alpha [Enterobacteriaceae endosymbiont of Macroplea appendiculata]|uniref:glycine--tRNA ligase subunit alpha n=1 Tax=Enterobacteriaceae endosymbiont of Macroplea appendiculata TaxID=2675790 RepID=UPI001448A859|nr:glycine--tRNA ligase subunit alpha [Enterobacteriaceae endosymbiont of Macroplea appendiculata]QJC30682.1 glycine--tRNA ligase subunit alpha [Enterobacteriaceae endosymbiont of Macroplea appendiculata]
MTHFSEKTFQGMIFILQKYWAQQGCIILQPIDTEVGAGTSHPMTCLYAISKKPYNIAYVQLSKRPTDGRYGNNPNRLQQYYQFQVMLKPPPCNIQDLYIHSLKSLNIDCKNNNITFIEDNWENPTLGAYGVGWEILLNGVEITQFTYFQKIGGLKCQPITGEITYGLERLGMHIQNIDNIFDLIWYKDTKKCVTYRDLFYQNEKEYSKYNFNYADTNFLVNAFQHYMTEIVFLLKLKPSLIFPAYNQLLKASHCFNLLESRKFFSITERKRFIFKLRNMTKDIVKQYYYNN